MARTARAEDGLRARTLPPPRGRVAGWERGGAMPTRTALLGAVLPRPQACSPSPGLLRRPPFRAEGGGS
ncbi:hypothetical protein Maq22A_1p38345 (plasmid) [Methylobacterium aquaticum]|uniref:Uncharacterized protein n=1 Tax=Methylobacterium aquaticum TaxID=270351 RepID=A0A1Y0ZCM9_9HYPH|nr:hypothetical protein Maq22A_1p38345 [Methylobacterium aquaticum]